ncbi:MAG: hypothetical protein C4533_07990 [Candidatus Omnitrophota bacterium]|jgi:hypothetical protein|nr:MAG: hypothetical protein C4533_07990 [Candidatus Omnitrophota bacterium]
MSSKRKLQIKFRQKLKRRRRRLNLLKKGIDPKDYYCGGYYIKNNSKPQWEESRNEDGELLKQ